MAYDKVVDSAVLDAGLKQVADAIREKGGTSDNLAFPTGMAAAVSAIQAGGGGNEDGYTLKIRAEAASLALCGFMKGLRNIDVDMNNQNRTIPQIQRIGTDKVGGKCTIRGIINHNYVSDMFRQGCIFSEIVFEPYWAPNELNRICYHPNDSQTEDGGTFKPPSVITVRGLRLDNITYMTRPFDASTYPAFNVLWEGTLSVDASFSDAQTLTDTSLALLINCLKDFSGTSETRTLTLGTTLLGRLTDEQITAASGKGWTLA